MARSYLSEIDQGHLGDLIRLAKKRMEEIQQSHSSIAGDGDMEAFGREYENLNGAVVALGRLIRTAH